MAMCCKYGPDRACIKVWYNAFSPRNRHTGIDDEGIIADAYYVHVGR